MAYLLVKAEQLCPLLLDKAMTSFPVTTVGHRKTAKTTFAIHGKRTYRLSDGESIPKHLFRSDVNFTEAIFWADNVYNCNLIEFRFPDIGAMLMFKMNFL